MTGLTAVIAGSRTYVGIIDREARDSEDKQDGCLVLKGAVELMTVPERTATGVQMRVMPLMITPADEPVPVFYVRYTAWFDRSSDQELIKVYRSMTGKSPIFVPGGRVRLPS